MNDFIKLDSHKDGHVLAIFCGVHGNEKTGILAVQKLLDNLILTKGILYIVFANPLAIKNNIRFVEQNLNRCFIKSQTGSSYEEKRAQFLMNVLDNCDALLDLHDSNTDNSISFAITDSGLDVVKHMNLEYVVTGFDKLEPGASDGYMHKLGKIGICLECGSIKHSTKNLDFAYDSILQYLQYFDAIDTIVPRHHINQKHLHVEQCQLVTSNSFKLLHDFSDFETLPKGYVIAQDEFKTYITTKEQVILFGSSNKPVGSEAYFLGSWVI